MEINSGAASFEWKGLDNVVRRLELLQGTLPPAIAARLYQECEAVMTDAKDNFVPVDTGNLRNSGFVEQPVIAPGRVSVRMGFGGAAEDYAVEQHENLDYRHTVGGAKYLERPLMMHAQQIKQGIAEASRDAIAQAAGAK